MVIRGKSVMKRMAYQDVRIEFEKSVNGPYNTVAEVGEGESKWHVFHTPCFDDQSLRKKNTHTHTCIHVMEINIRRFRRKEKPI